MITEIAPAKINLYLHVGGVREDGLHDLASLFVFADQGDEVQVEHDQALSLTIKGPFADELLTFSLEENLIMGAARALKVATGYEGGAKINLTKNLPIASGIGGGSADAAAALRALIRLWDIKITDSELHKIAFKLGADVPPCLYEKPLFVSGAGEQMKPAPSLPPLWVCLVNPRVPTPTGPVFQAYDQNYPFPPSPIHMKADDFISIQNFKRGIATTTNDLQPPAMSMVPQVREVCVFLKASKNIVLARMSGSGATCFGLYGTMEDAKKASVTAMNRNWWSMAARIIQ